MVDFVNQIHDETYYLYEKKENNINIFSKYSIIFLCHARIILLEFITQIVSFFFFYNLVKLYFTTP